MSEIETLAMSAVATPDDRASARLLKRLRNKEIPPADCVNGGGIMHHAERSGGPVAAAQKCATHGPLLVVARGRRCTAWSSMRRFDWRLSTRG